MKRMIFTASIALSLGLLAAPVQAQNYPTKPVRIVTAEVGGGHDFTARLLAQGLSTRLGQQFVVENRAGVQLAGSVVAKAAPDGYTVLLFGGNLWVDPMLRPDDKTYDIDKDFAPIGLEVNAPILIVAHPSLPVSNVKELIALAKSKPGTLNYATGQVGAATYLASELFKTMANIDMVQIPFKGNGPATNALISGQVHLMFPTAGSVAQLLKSGKIKALAITSAQPSPLFPDLPTAASGGLPGYQGDSIIGAFAPSKVAPATINFLSKEMAAAVNSPDIKSKFAVAGIDTIGSTPQVLAATVQSERVRVAKLIKDLNIKPE